MLKEMVAYGYHQSERLVNMLSNIQFIFTAFRYYRV